jgi:DNA-binding MarR family transcriptional regulator
MNTLIYTVQVMNNQQKEDTATLEILQAIEEKKDVTQRHIADRLDVALGLANSYLKRCVRKGLVKIHQAPANRYLYYLTPKGFSEKSRLTAEYLSTSFDFYRRAGDSLTDIYKQCVSQGHKDILFCGVSELAEIASTRSHEHDINIVGGFDPYCEKKIFLHLPIWKNYKNAEKHDVCLITALDKPDSFYTMMLNEVDKCKILVPSILGINQ